MKKLSIALTAAVIAIPAMTVPNVARADNGQVTIGILGGLIGGALLGSALAPRHYYGPGPVYVEPAPVYVAPPYSCYWTRGAPVWDDWRGVWVHPRVQVCD